jgi:tRNA pseudouridine32 synthase / 23S rRNA pseudouridine746 synthase
MATTAPSRAGVSASTVYLPAEMATTCGTMLEFFAQTFPKIDASIWQERFDQGLVVDEAGHAVSPSAIYVPKQHLFYYRHVESEPRIPFDEVVLYQDEHLVVADKPHFLPVTPSGRYVQETLLVRLKNKLGLPELSPLHRLDRDTAGLVLFGVQAKERGAHQQMFHDRQVHKTYEAIAPYRPDLLLPLDYESRLEDSNIYMQMHEVAGKPNSRTQIALQSILPARPDGERAGERLAIYELKPVTGKRHQLRVHMNALGIPILNDGIYPTLTPEQLVMTDADYAKPLQLLAKSLSFVDPITKAKRVFESGRRLQLEFPT